ncbi:MAG: DUF4180 domain-containing protein [Clostridia bacterium]|nr:DUF4180 domain-containing protein [Clostridia bacterium]
MNIETIHRNGVVIAHLSETAPVITDVQTALDAAMTARYDVQTDLLAIDKRAICEDFFILSRGLAGEILQKYTNYHIHVAIYGDYSRYASKPLRDFIYESNKGNHVFFVPTLEEALDRLSTSKG